MSLLLLLGQPAAPTGDVSTVAIFDGVHQPRLIVMVSLGGQTELTSTTYQIGVGPGIGTGSIGGTAWLEVTQDVDAVDIQGPQLDEIESASSGTCTLTLDDTSGAYDPDNPDGPYSVAPNLLAGDNGDFEASVGTWLVEANAATPVRSVGHAHTGRGALLMESLAAGLMSVRHAPAPGQTNGVAVDPATVYRISGSFRPLGDAPIQPRSGKVAHGVSADDAAAFVTAAGKDLAIEHWYESWGARYNIGFDTTKATGVHNAGRVNLITWEPWLTTGGATQPTYALSTIIAGNHDAHITAWAQGAAAFGQPMFLRWGHEMNGDWYPWGTKGGVNGNTTAQYVAAWQRIWGIFQAQGADNVTWVWAPNRPFSGTPPMASVYPGDGYVDWMALDAYNHGTDQGGSWLSVATTFDAGFAELRAVNDSKPVMISETGCSTNGGDKAAWISDLFTALAATYTYVRALVYFNHDKLAEGSSNFRIQDPAGAQTAYAAGIANSRYAASKTAAFGSSATQPVQVGVNWYNPSGYIRTDFGSAATETAGGWTTPPVLEAESPADATRAVVLARVQSTGAAGEMHYVDDVSVRPADNPLLNLDVAVWVRAEWGGLYTTRFLGVVDDIQPDDAPPKPTVTVRCVDGLAQLGRARLAALSLPDFDGDRTGNRVHRILDAAAWPSSKRAVDPGRSRLGRTTLGASAWQLLAEVEKTEFGWLWVEYRTGGTLTFYQRYQTSVASRSTTVQATISDTGGMNQLVRSKSREQLFNDVHVQRNPAPTAFGDDQAPDEPVEQVATDLTSVDRYGLLSYPGTAFPLARNDAEALAGAQWLAPQYATPQTRITQVGVAGLGWNQWYELLGLRLLDRIRVQRTTAVALDTQLLITQISEEIRRGANPAWNFQFATTTPPATEPASTYQIGVGPGIGTGQIGF